MRYESAYYDQDSRLLDAKYTLVNGNFVIELDYVRKQREHIDLDHYVTKRADEDPQLRKLKKL